MQGTYSEPVISLDRELGSVKVDAEVRVPTTLSAPLRPYRNESPRIDHLRL